MWSEKDPSLALPTFDWTGIANALAAVKAV